MEIITYLKQHGKAIGYHANHYKCSYCRDITDLYGMYLAYPDHAIIAILETALENYDKNHRAETELAYQSQEQPE